MAKVLEEVAREEVEKWLEYKKVSARKREQLADNIESLVDYISDGSLTLDQETMAFKQQLLFPLGNNRQIEVLVYQPRLNLKDLSLQNKGVSAQDQNGRIMAIVAGLTGQPKAITGTMDSEDASIAQAIAVFFV
jgi:hypothetical protein